VNLPDYVRLARREAERQLQAAQRAVKRAADEGARAARARTRDVGAVDTHEFMDGWKAERRAEGYAVTNPSPHAPWADDGRPPGSPPPVVALVRWAERKLRIGGPQAWAVATQIAKQIAERGVKGAKVLEWVARRLELDILPRELDKELDRS
jgi:hypothetical protein